MSTEKGNINRNRPQKHQNKTKFKNDLHDKSHKMKLVNNIVVDDVCIRCKNIIEWKIKYKKYKPLKFPANCVKCHNRNVMHAYHTMCSNCSKNLKVCPKCGENKELVKSTSIKSIENLLQSSEVKEAVKSLSERKRRTFFRHLNNPSCNLKTEEEILQKLNEMTIGSGGNMLDDFELNELEESNENDSGSGLG